MVVEASEIHNAGNHRGEAFENLAMIVELVSLALLPDLHFYRTWTSTGLGLLPDLDFYRTWTSTGPAKIPILISQSVSPHPPEQVLNKKFINHAENRFPAPIVRGIFGPPPRS
jgi:hypothetical protein